MDAFIESFLRACPQQEEDASSASAAQRPPLTQAAVLLPLFEDPSTNTLHVVLTVRSKRLRKHAGEVCFPGGKLDDADNGDVVVAALREAEEEIGLVPVEVEVIGRMRPTLSLHLLEVHPVVARIPHDFVERARPNPEEVADVFSLPLDTILNPPRGAYSVQDLDWFAPWRMHSFVYRQYEVWGLTAETLVRLAVLSFPSHPFSFDVRHPDGSDMEGWMERVLQLPAFQAEAERVARRYGAGGGKKGQAGLGGGGGGGGGGTNNDGEEKGSGESADAGAARRRRRALK